MVDIVSVLHYEPVTYKGGALTSEIPRTFFLISDSDIFSRIEQDRSHPYSKITDSWAEIQSEELKLRERDFVLEVPYYSGAVPMFGEPRRLNELPVYGRILLIKADAAALCSHLQYCYGHIPEEAKGIVELVQEHGSANYSRAPDSASD